METKKVYIVIKNDYTTGQRCFYEAFFSKEKAQAFISKYQDREDMRVETYEEQEDGTVYEVL